MSRIDEALRRAARAERSPDAPSESLPPEPQAAAIDLSILDRYSPEAPAPLRESVQKKSPAPVTAAVRTDTPVRPISIPPELADKLVIGPGISPLTVEQYRRLAAELHDLQTEQGLKSLMVTSAAPQEGKTLTVANLALTLSESYHQRVLLIDLDLRRPSIHGVFGIPNAAGLSDVVTSGGAAPLVPISRWLSVLTAGRRLDKPLAMLTSERVRNVIAEVGAGFDWVLLDTPPVGFLPDAQLVARLSEATLFVIAAGVTPYSLVQRAISEVGSDRLVGTVLNRVDKRMLHASASYGGYYGAYAENASQR